MTFSEVVERVLPLATAMHGYYEAELPKHYRDYPLMNPGEVDPPPPPEENQLRELLDRLPDDVIFKLLVLKEVGTQVRSNRDLARRYEALKRTYDERRWAVDTLLRRLSYGEPLWVSVEEMKDFGIDMDELASVHA